jgi:hypothetical protein
LGEGMTVADDLNSHQWRFRSKKRANKKNFREACGFELLFE